MHDSRTAAIITRAKNQAREVFAKLPVRTKLALLVVAASVDSFLRSWGKTIYSAFLLNGVEGLPPLEGTPLEGKNLSRLRERPELLPADYGQSLAFAKAVFGTLKKMHRFKREDADANIIDAMSTVAAVFLAEKRHLMGKTLDHAQAAVMTAAKNQLIKPYTKSKAKKRQPSDSMMDSIDEKPEVLESGHGLSDRAMVTKLDDLLTPEDIREIKIDLKYLEKKPYWLDTDSLPGIIDLIVAGELSVGGIQAAFTTNLLKEHGIPYPVLNKEPAEDDFETRRKHYKSFHAQVLPLMKEVLSEYITPPRT